MLHEKGSSAKCDRDGGGKPRAACKSVSIIKADHDLGEDGAKEAGMTELYMSIMP